MCSTCYRKYGRAHYATECEHKDKLMYSLGMCQACYLADYHKVRKILWITFLVETSLEGLEEKHITLRPW